MMRIIGNFGLVNILLVDAFNFGMMYPSFDIVVGFSLTSFLPS